MDADDDIDIYGRFGVVLELQDDDDQNSVGEYNIEADNFLATGRNDVVFMADGGGDIVVDSESAEFIAGGDFIAEFRNAAEFDSDSDFVISSFGPVRFDIGEDMTFDLSQDVDMTANGALLSSLTDSMILQGTDVVFEVGNTDTQDFQSASEDMVMHALEFIDFDASNSVTISTARGGSVDFREGLKIPSSTPTELRGPPLRLATPSAAPSRCSTTPSSSRSATAATTSCRASSPTLPPTSDRERSLLGAPPAFVS
eukprot:TRINITY_DN7280_c0_g1_i1.p1 TRINITY_DN7280_c0_g1~~TRINITY_DN7280_c0_g1_i1.p1  ORF type:complete len:256 (-),score=38.93 TRINITY_DN7280_c0_g1_i1:38-805(-)